MDIRSAEFAHDLKMPIQLIYSCVQLLEMELQAGSRAQDYLRMLMQSANQLQTMVNHALDDDRSAALRMEKTDIVAEVRSICRQTELFAGEKRISIGFWSNAAELTMRTDREKLDRMLHNLLSNALRFTPEDGKIGVYVRLMGDSVEIAVSDTGCGISDAHRIFERGYTTGGHGYGLAIVREYAQMLGGSVRASANPEGGSCFTLWLPVRS